jgi:16S rRNA (uracil1498-N3)-methyltransferase
MEQPYFYAPPEKIKDDLIELPAAESRHARTVLRLTAGSPVVVVDGLGLAYRGEIIRSKKTEPVVVRVHRTVRNLGEPTVQLKLAAGLSTGSKFDSVVQKGTELGVSRFVPLLCEKGIVRLDDPSRVQRRTSRLEKVALAAMKQCRRSYRPSISPPVKINILLNEIDAEETKLCFNPGERAESLDLIDWNSVGERITLLVGPESGFAPAEMTEIRQAGFVEVGLGHRILRTETAAPIACALVMHSLGELK